MSENLITDEILISELSRRFEENKNALQELKILNDQLLELNNKLKESEALKSHFISNITNEIVNPFASILGLARNITQIKEGEWQRAKQMAHLIYSESFNLDFQFKNIFAAAEIEAGETTPNIVKTQLIDVLKAVIDLYKNELEKRKITIEIDEKGDIVDFYTDAEKIRIILSNLLSNAIKFSHLGGNIFVYITLTQEQAIIRVKDSGIGISATNQQIIFDRFKRIDNGINSLNRGHGLGLSIIKAFIDLLGGTIIVESAENIGTEFIIQIPNAPSDTSSGFTSDGDEIFFDDIEKF